MQSTRTIHADFRFFLDFKEADLIVHFHNLRELILEIYPESNEILYHTHALTAVYSITDKLSDAFCMLPIYTNHLNLGFNKGTLLADPENLLKGTGTLIRHVPIGGATDYQKDSVRSLIQRAVELAQADLRKPSKVQGMTISKIKK